MIFPLIYKFLLLESYSSKFYMMFDDINNNGFILFILYSSFSIFRFELPF